MSPDKARVLIVEDDKIFGETEKDWLTYGGHKVVGQAETVSGAIEVLRKFCEGGEVKEGGFLKRKPLLNVVVVDGKLPDGGGEEVVKAVKKMCGPEVKTVGMSGGGSVEGVDVDLGKNNLEALSRVIKEL